MDKQERAAIAGSRILLVDDNPDNLEVLLHFLESEAYKVRVARDGEQALRSIQADCPDLAVLDIHMPGMDGYELVTRIRALPKGGKLPVIFVSGLHESFNKRQAADIGIADYIDKPVDRDELRFRVANVLLLSWYRRRLGACESQSDLDGDYQ